MNLVGASIGRTAVYDLRDVTNINQAVAIIRLPKSTANLCPEFLLHYLNSPSAIHIMMSSQVITATKHQSDQCERISHSGSPAGRTTANRGEGGRVDALVRRAGSPAHRRPIHGRHPVGRHPPPNPRRMISALTNRRYSLGNIKLNRRNSSHSGNRVAMVW
jgi:hypothetical protein